MKQHALVLLFFLAVGAVWSWPAPLLDPQRLPVRHFDLFPVLWLLHHAPEIGLDLRVETSAWPAGETLARLDSWVLLLLGWLLRPLLSATSVAMLLAWWGPALSAFAAERAAVTLGATRPWSLVAGLVYGFSGVAASAALEGHVPHLLQPWLPLCLAAGWRAGDPDGRPVHGLLAGLGASLALLTTAYHGLVAALLLLGLGLRTLRRPAPLLAALAPLVPVVGWLAWLFSLGEAEAVPPRRALEIASLGSATMESLLIWTPRQDALGHSVGAPMGGLLLAGLLLGWRHRTLLLLALLGILLSFGPELALSSDGPSLPSPLAFLWHSPAASVLRFPVRFAWLTTLCGGVLLALALSRAAPRLGTPARAAVLGLALLDPFVLTGMPGRQGQQSLPPPASSGEGAVLDLYATAAFPARSDIDMRARVGSCAAQVAHGRPTLARCIGTGLGDPRTEASTWLLARLLQPGGAPADTARALARAGVGEVALHPEWLRPEDLPALRAALDGLLGAPVLDHPQRVAWRVPGPLASAAQAAASSPLR